MAYQSDTDRELQHFSLFKIFTSKKTFNIIYWFVVYCVKYKIVSSS